jgi:hypothetical protein
LAAHRWNDGAATVATLVANARGVHVVTTKPGRVDTPMTAGLAPSALSVHPRRVARPILRAADRSPTSRGSGG